MKAETIAAAEAAERTRARRVIAGVYNGTDVAPGFSPSLDETRDALSLSKGGFAAELKLGPTYVVSCSARLDPHACR